MSEPRTRSLLPSLVYAALSTAVVSSLGMLLVPSISRHFDVPLATAQWMLTINLLVGAVATPVMGRLSDGPHKKRMLIVALAIVLLGSVITALATNFAVFLIGRALQGLTYGIVPMTIAIARRYLPADTVDRGISSLSVTVATGLGIGYPLTGIIAGTFEYQYAFWFAALFTASAIAVVLVAVPAGPDEVAPRIPFDIVGAVLLGSGLGLLLLAVSEGEHWGWTGPATLGCFAAAIVVLAGWARVELRSAHPLINLRVLRNSEVLLANATAIGVGTAMYMGLSIGSLVAQAPTSTSYGVGLPVFWAGFVMLPLSVGSFAANRASHHIVKHIRTATLLPVGATIITASAAVLLFMHNQLWEILLGMFMFGVGIGATFAAMPALIARSVAAEELGSAVSFNQVLRTVGGSIGSAISGAVLAAHLTADGRPTGHGVNLAFGMALVMAALVLVALLIDHRRAATLGPARSVREATVSR